MQRAIAIEPAESDGAASAIGPEEPTHESVSTARPMPAPTPVMEP